MLNSADYTAIKLLLKIGYPKLSIAHLTIHNLDRRSTRRSLRKGLSLSTGGLENLAWMLFPSWSFQRQRHT